ncbi:hypothetical protein ACSVNK_03675 [Salmonella enterica]|uniref:hypothetical protein n=1 Tax=Salmonella enterica TaxID=28901 RepID=UPI0009AF94D9|nr:hypothetical protein [Salmonella enterica]
MKTNHPAHGPVSLERLHQIREILSKAAAQSDGGNLGYAMADAVKVIDGVLSIPATLPCPVHLEPGLKFGKGVRTQCLMDALRRRADYYAELEAMMPEQRAEHDAWIAEFKAMLGSGFRDLSQPVDPQIAEYEKVMLQDGNSPVIPDDWVMVPKEPTQAMIKAWLSEVANFRGHAAGYRAALEAAPQLEVNRG